MTTPNPALTADEQRNQELEIALERARGHVTELRRLASVGSPFYSLVPYLDQLDADLNTLRPVHVGWANYQAPDPTGGVVSTPTGVAGNPTEPIQAPAPAETEPEEVGEDGLTDSERAASAEEHPAL